MINEVIIGGVRSKLAEVEIAQQILVEKSILRDDLAKTLDYLQFQYEVNIGTLALKCFDSFSQMQRLNAKVNSFAKTHEKASEPLNSSEQQKFLREVDQKYQEMKDHHRDILNNYFCNFLGTNETQRFHEMYRFFNCRLNMDINPNLTIEELDIWHEAQEKYLENDIHGLERLIQQYHSLNEHSDFEISDLTEKELNYYLERINSALHIIDDEIEMISNPNFHPFWKDLMNQHELTEMIQEKIEIYQSINSSLKEYLESEFLEKNPKMS